MLACYVGAGIKTPILLTMHQVFLITEPSLQPRKEVLEIHWLALGKWECPALNKVEKSPAFAVLTYVLFVCLQSQSTPD